MTNLDTLKAKKIEGFEELMERQYLLKDQLSDSAHRAVILDFLSSAIDESFELGRKEGS